MEEIKPNTNKIEPEKTGYSAKLVEAIKTGSAERVLEVLTEIDRLVIPGGGPNDSGMHLFRQDVEEFIKEVAQNKDYLVAVVISFRGGYSRLVIQYYEGEYKFVMSQYDEESKANWEKIK